MSEFKYEIYDYSKAGIGKKKFFLRKTLSNTEWEAMKTIAHTHDEAAKILYEEIKKLVRTQQAHIDYDELPNGYQDEAADFINQLIQRKPKNRLGRDGIGELINHPWLNGFDWDELKKKHMKAYYIPKEGDNFDKKYCLQNNKMGTETIERYKEITLEPNYSKIFKKFDCDKVPDELKFFDTKLKLADMIIDIVSIRR